MADFLTTNGTSYYIEQIILEAKKELYLVTPFLQLSKTFFERLKDASKRGVIIRIVYGKDELKPNEKNSIAEIDNLELFFFENLHAKCYFNENDMVITSMNMYEFSEKNNREMGVHIQREKDSEIYVKAINEAKSIISSSEPQELKKTKRALNKLDDGKNSNFKSKKDIRGYCIRCQARIPFDPEKPYCPSCFSTWAHYQNIHFKETVCHGCGEYGPSTMSTPICEDCGKEYYKGKK
jgi:phosphatidylserine/phosphatidylglycerophosphate/cardiolipin synthase-like enzyme